MRPKSKLRLSLWKALSVCLGAASAVALCACSSGGFAGNSENGDVVVENVAKKASGEPKAGDVYEMPWLCIGHTDRQWDTSGYVGEQVDSYGYDEGNRLNLSVHDDKNGYCRINEYTYNDDNSVAAHREITKNASGDYRDINNTVYEYDEDGNTLAEATTKRTAESETEEFETITYEYAEDGTVMKYEDGEFYDSIYSEEDENGNVIHSIYTESNGRVTERNSTYDENNNLTRSTATTTNGGEIASSSDVVFNNYYDDKGRLVFANNTSGPMDGRFCNYEDDLMRSFVYVEDGELDNQTINIRDENGLLLVRWFLDPSGTSSLDAYEYKNTLTGEVVSGYTYYDNAFNGEYQLYDPQPYQVTFDINSYYEEITGNVADGSGIDYYLYYPEYADLMSYDPSVDTTPDYDDFPYALAFEYSLGAEPFACDAYSIDLPNAGDGGGSLDCSDWIIRYDPTVNEYIDENGMGYYTTVYDADFNYLFEVAAYCGSWGPQGDLDFADIGTVMVGGQQMSVYVSAPADGSSTYDLDTYASWVRLHLGQPFE